MYNKKFISCVLVSNSYDPEIVIMTKADCPHGSLNIKKKIQDMT